MKKLLKAVVLVMTVCILTLCSCGDQTQEAANHERPVFNLCYSINHNDSRTFLNCFIPPAKKKYLSSDESKSKDAVSDLLDKSGIEANDLSCEIIGKRELASADCEKLQKEYKKNYSKNDNFEKAFQIDACFTSSKGTDIRKLTVVLIDNNWYINSDVIQRFRFDSADTSEGDSSVSDKDSSRSKESSD